MPMSRNKLILVGMGIILGGFFIAQNLVPGEPSEDQKLNKATSAYMDSCLNTLPEGNQECSAKLQQMKQETCSSFPAADICNDGRIEKYYAAVQK